GYPYGLSGKGIPLMGRVLCLADSFDAMTSSRTYRKALPLEVAIAEIQRSAGTQFDPELAEIFVGIGIDRFLRLLHDHEQKSKRMVDLQEALRACRPGRLAVPVKSEDYNRVCVISVSGEFVGPEIA